MGQKVVVKNVQLNWPYLFATTQYKQNAPKFQATSNLDPKRNKRDIELVQAAMDAAAAEAPSGKKATLPPTWKLDDGAYRLRASASEARRPQVIDADMQPIIDKGEIYSGCFCNVALDVYYNKEHECVAVGLIAVQKISDGDRLDGYVEPDVEELFKPIDVSGSNPDCLD